jgi:hypothetical protein
MERYVGKHQKEPGHQTRDTPSPVDNVRSPGPRTVTAEVPGSVALISDAESGFKVLLKQTDRDILSATTNPGQEFFEALPGADTVGPAGVWVFQFMDGGP